MLMDNEADGRAVGERANGHVAVYFNKLPRGGAQRATLTVISALVDRVQQIDLVLAKREGGFIDEVPAGVRVVELGKSNRRSAMREVRALWRPFRFGLALHRLFFGRLPGATRALPQLIDYLRRERPDVILTTLRECNFVVLWAVARAGTGTRVVLREANHFSAQLQDERHQSPGMFYDLAKAWYPRADAIIAVSKGVADDLVQTLSLDPKLVQVVHNAVDTKRVAAALRDGPDHPWFSTEAPPIILGVGRLEPQKNWGLLLDAVAILAQARPIRLILLGEGTERAKLEAKVAKLGLSDIVALAGEVANVFPYMARAAVLVLASRYEGFPNVLLEALACGSRVVSTRCPSGPEEILDGGRYGRLVPVDDAGALAEAIEGTLEEPPNAALGMQRAQDFGLGRMADRYLSILLPDWSETALAIDDTAK
jgi:glycosyltransferase involved in cell wall biosynthesis